MIVEQINARLKAVSGVTSIVGERIYPHHLPQGATLPALSHMQLGFEPVHAMSADPNIQSLRLQVSCWASQYSQAKTLAKAVRDALSRHRATAESDEFLDVLVDNEIDDFDPETEVYQVVVDLLVWYREA